MMRKHQQGATLIEIAITVLVLSTSLLAMANLQTKSLKFNQSAYMRSQANIHAYDIIDRIRINRGADSVNIDDYNIDYGDSASGSGLIGKDLGSWLANISRDLPGGEGEVECVVATRICKVSIRWSEKQIFGEKDQDDDETISEFVYTTSI